jgi:hypothetical protein
VFLGGRVELTLATLAMLYVGNLPVFRGLRIPV